jgi:hypothetical protein
MRSLTLRKTALAVVVPLALGSLAACGNDDSTNAADPQAAGPSSSSVAAPEESGSPSPSATTDPGTSARDVDPAAFAHRLQSAVRALTTARFTMSMDLGGQSVEAKGALDMTGDQPAMQISMDLTGMGTPTDMRIVDGSLYIQDPTTGTGKYLEMDLDDPSGPLGDMGDALDNYNPNAMLGRLSPDMFRKVTDLGSETVGGRELEHFRVVLDSGAASRLVKNLPSTASLPKTMTYDLWLDSENRMAKFTMLMKKVSRVSATYTDYGEDLHISAPPASQVMSMSGSASG